MSLSRLATQGMNPIVRMLVISDFFVLAGIGFLGPILPIFIADQIPGGSVKVAGLPRRSIWRCGFCRFRWGGFSTAPAVIGTSIFFWLLGGLPLPRRCFSLPSPKRRFIFI